MSYNVFDAMALLEKIISTKRNFEYGICESRKGDRSCHISPEQVRLLLFKECDWRGRKLLFDSCTIDKVPAKKDDKATVRQTDKVPCIVEVAEGFSYVYKGPAPDASVLGEMIFGAVAINYKGVSLKIHIMDDPKRLMCTKVFCVPTMRRARSGKEASGVARVSKQSNVGLLEDLTASFTMDRGDSGYYENHSPHSSVDSTYDFFSMFECNENQDEWCSFHSLPGRKLSTSSNGSWQRRTFQNLATRFDLGYQSSNLLNVPTAISTDSQMYSNSSASGTNESLASTSSVTLRKNKLGLALLITADSADMDLIRRCVEHSPQLQSLVCRLRLATLIAGAGTKFVSTLHRASVDAARCLSDLMYGPRLQPAWLNLVTSDARAANKMADALLADLCSVLSLGDTKNTNFFISTLLTHVLTYHLGWVTTVSPYDTVDPTNRPTDTDQPPRYNALWAQLSDLCGSIGFPPRIAKTIICGSTNTQLINRILIVLTYFVRCGQIKRNEFQYQDCAVKETKVINLNTATRLKLDSVVLNTEYSDSSVSTLVASEGLKRSATLANITPKLSKQEFSDSGSSEKPMTSNLRRNPTMLLTLNDSDLSLDSSTEEFKDPSVVFVLGDDEKLVGLKNKSSGGKRVKKSSKIHNEPVNLDVGQNTKETCNNRRNTESPSKCCAQTLQHSKPIKHSGFKFEFDKYPQIVTNYMKSKNLEILDRHYIGKPGNLKLDNYQFDPTIVPSLQEEKCEECYKLQQMASVLQTPTNASEMEFMNDIPRNSEPQYAIESVVNETQTHREMSPKTFTRARPEKVLVVNIKPENSAPGICVQKSETEGRTLRERVKENDRLVDVKQVIEFEMPDMCSHREKRPVKSGFEASLLGGVTDHYVPDLVLQGTLAKPESWEPQLRQDLDLTTYLNKSPDTYVQAVAIIGDTNTWEVRVIGRENNVSGMSSLVGGMLDALPAMWRAKVPAHHCLTYLESKLREFCIISKTLADMLMSTDFCDVATLTKSLNIDVSDVPLLLAVATTHTPQIATRYGISYM